MPEADDIQLLREFAERQSETAFGELVRRHVNLVYSIGLRQTGNPHAAEEITQAVFIILARKVGSFGRRTILSGWLYQTARLTAANFLRTERRRAFREQEAYMQSLSNEPEPEVWPQIAPLLEEAMAELGEKERDAVVLRFFENKSLGEVGAALGTSEDAAKMRVNRALEKLRRIFVKRGAILSAAAIAGAVSANSVQAAPLQIGVSVAAASLGKAAVSTSVGVLLKVTLQQLLWLKLRTALAVVLGVSLIGVGSGGIMYHQSRSSVPSSTANGGLLPSNFLGNQPAQQPAIEPVTRPAGLPTVIRIKLLGTPGLPFQVAYSADGQPQTAKGVLPDEVAFNADAFSATIKVQGPGEFGFEIYRGDLQQASAAAGPITNSRTVSIEGKAGGTGLSMSGKSD